MEDPPSGGLPLRRRLPHRRTIDGGDGLAARKGTKWPAGSDAVSGAETSGPSQVCATLVRPGQRSRLDTHAAAIVEAQSVPLGRVSGRDPDGPRRRRRLGRAAILGRAIGRDPTEGVAPEGGARPEIVEECGKRSESRQVSDSGLTGPTLDIVNLSCSEASLQGACRIPNALGEALPRRAAHGWAGPSRTSGQNGWQSDKDRRDIRGRRGRWPE